jgi:hypothetical protein
VTDLREIKMEYLRGQDLVCTATISIYVFPRRLSQVSLPNTVSTKYFEKHNYKILSGVMIFCLEKYCAVLDAEIQLSA